MIPLETGPLSVKEEEKPEALREALPELTKAAKPTLRPAVLVPRQQDQRQLQVSQLNALCKKLEIDLPAPGSREERILNALAHRYYKNVENRLKDLVDAKTLPGGVEAMKDANIPREQKWREQVRHWASYPVALVVSGVSGAIGTAVASVADAFVAAICHAPVVMGAGLAVFVITFLVKAYQYSQTTQALNGNIVGSILGWSVLWAVGAGLVAGLGQAAYLYGKRLKEQKRAEEGWG